MSHDANYLLMPFVGMKLSPYLLAGDDLVEPHCRAGEGGGAGKDSLGGLFRYKVGRASGYRPWISNLRPAS